jgi:hypothetical protein
MQLLVFVVRTASYKLAFKFYCNHIKSSYDKRIDPLSTALIVNVILIYET